MGHTIQKRSNARLVLEDGSVFRGAGFGACGAGLESSGEVVFNTAMTGYQEALTDPSYSGQILTMTTPMVGNYGIAQEDVESGRPQVAGFVVRELSRIPSSYRAYTDLSSWLREAGVMGIEGIDTRALVRRLRTGGAMRGVLSSGASRSDAELVEQAGGIPVMSGQNLAAVASVTTEATFGEDLGEWGKEPKAEPSQATLKIVALDCGAKRNIYRHFVDRGCSVAVLPYDTSPEAIRASGADGLFISNGPGDPAAVDATVATLREVAGELPTFGICLGHQLLALALGAGSYKLKFGHRGVNQPVRNLLTGRIEITSQNHGFCVDGDSLAAADCEMTHIHLNDNTLAGFRHRSKPIFSVQYHPEASPGPHDSTYLFDCFVEMMTTRQPITADLMSRFQS